MSGFLRGRLSPTILTVEDGPEPSTDIQEALIDNAFNFSDEELEKLHVGETRSGWMNGAKNEANFDDINLWNVSGGTQVNHLVFRIAEKKLKPSDVKRRLKEACESWKRENDRARVPRTVKEELKEKIVLELEARTLVSFRETEVVWYKNDERHEVVICSQAEWATESIRKAMLNHFGVTTQILTVEQLIGTENMKSLSGQIEANFLQELMEIFWREQEVALDSGVIRTWGKATLEGGEGKTSIKAVGGLPDEEIDTIIRINKKKFTSIGFELIQDENIYSGEICQPLSIKGLALPRVDGEESDHAGSLVLRLDLLQNLINSIKESLLKLDKIFS